jgi:hypothetical protein
VTDLMRLVELVKAVLEQDDLDGSVVLVCLDCFLAFPVELIPKRPSLRYMANDAVSYFLGVNRHCEVHYPDVAKFIRKWKRVWWPRRERPKPIGLNRLRLPPEQN